jgi:hypothetical protein
MTLQVPPASTAERPRTVIWIDSRTAILARWDGTETTVVRLRSDVPVHRRSTGHVTHHPAIPHGGGVAPQTDGEARRLEHLGHFLRTVAERIAAYDALDILGPGTVHERLAALMRDEDAAQHRERPVTVAAAPPLTERQIIARLRALAGFRAPRGRRPRALPAPRRGRPTPPPPLDEEPG